MTTSIPISAALLRNITDRKWNNDSAVPAFETGTMTQGPSKGPVNAFERHVKRMTLKSSREWQRTPERAAMVRQRRGLGSCSRMPYDMRHQYTEGERAALFAVADTFLRKGFCDLPINVIAKRAGVRRTTVQNAIRYGRRFGHLHVRMRPRKGQKNAPNVITIISKEWLLWLEFGSIGFKTLNANENPKKTLSQQGKAKSENGARKALEKGDFGLLLNRADPLAEGVGEPDPGGHRRRQDSAGMATLGAVDDVSPVG